MKMASQLRKFCPRCNTHTQHQISAYKAGKRRSMAEGERRMKRKTRGYGSFPKPRQKRFSKTTKKSLIKLKCTECGHTLQGIKGGGLRLSKVEIEHA